jgi:hypothetical protein
VVTGTAPIAEPPHRVGRLPPSASGCYRIVLRSS